MAGETRTPRSNGKGWADLDPAAKAQGERFIKQGLVKDKDTYAKEYFAA